MLLSRRRILCFPIALVACTKKEPPPPAPATVPKPASPRTTTHAGVEAIELFPNDADETSPLVVMIHGLGDRPQNWVEGLKSFPAKAQLVLPRAFTPHGSGYSWFRFEDGMTDEQSGAAVGESEAKLWPALVAIAAGRRMIVTGFSQGGILSFALASRHPDAIARAFPVAGACPGPLLPKNKSRAAPVLAFHGTKDAVIDVKYGRETVDAFKTEGNDAVLKEYEGVGHTIAPQMREDWTNALVAAIQSTERANPRAR